MQGVPQLREAALRARRIGLGIMGLGDLMFHCSIRYGSDEGQEFAGQVMEFVRYQAMKESVALAEARGAFPAIKGSIYDAENFRWSSPTPLRPYKRDFGRPEINWPEITEGIKTHGIRNAAQTTIAPTGTIATVTGCEGYGCEPAFALAYIRHMNDNGKDVLLPYASPLFDKALKDSGLDEKKRQEIVEQVMNEGTCQNIKDLPASIRNTFVVSSDITPEEHVGMQASLQAFVDNSLSKTVNLPAGATTDDVAKVYMQSWKLGCKGTTVYVTGSRDKVVLETKSTMESKQEGQEVLPADVKVAEPEQAQMPLWHDKKKARPHSLHGFTYRSDTPVGKAFITINERPDRSGGVSGLLRSDRTSGLLCPAPGFTHRTEIPPGRSSGAAARYRRQPVPRFRCQTGAFPAGWTRSYLPGVSCRTRRADAGTGSA